ncbi:MAG: DUF309 domain-containing protein [bacterium]
MEVQAEAGNKDKIVFKYFELGLFLFNNQEFYLAHESFEKAWNITDNKDKLFLQGLIQISVGSYFCLNCNYINAVKQYKKGINKLELFRPVFMNVDVEKLLFWINELLLEMNFTKNDIILTKKIKSICLID